ncbi:HB2D protein, partial [Polypterus senegalus]|nr:HB2D protein [Polypterus senegalus]
MLTCNAFGFYPRQIKVTWLKNGEKVKSGVTSTDEFSNGDWYYQIYSQWDVVPLSGETYSCRVEHVSLSKPITINWGRILVPTS